MLPTLELGSLDMHAAKGSLLDPTPFPLASTVGCPVLCQDYKVKLHLQRLKGIHLGHIYVLHQRHGLQLVFQLTGYLGYVLFEELRLPLHKLLHFGTVGQILEALPCVLAGGIAQPFDKENGLQLDHLDALNALHNVLAPGWLLNHHTLVIL